MYADNVDNVLITEQQVAYSIHAFKKSLLAGLNENLFNKYEKLEETLEVENDYSKFKELDLEFLFWIQNECGNNEIGVLKNINVIIQMAKKINDFEYMSIIIPLSFKIWEVKLDSNCELSKYLKILEQVLQGCE
jgi:hypothetical protein